MRAEGVDLMALHTYAMQRRLIAEQAVAISSVAGSRFTESMSWDRESVAWRMATLVPPDFLRMFRDASCLQRDAVRWLLAHNDLAELKLMEMLVVIDIDLYVASLDLQVEMGDLAERVTKAARPDLMGYLGGSAHRCTFTWTLDELVNMEADWRLVLQVLEANFPLSTTVEAARVDDSEPSIVERIAALEAGVRRQQSAISIAAAALDIRS